MAGISDYLIWYAKNKENVKYRELFEEKPIGENTGYTWIEFPDGSRRKMSSDERKDARLLPLEGRVFFTSALASSGYTETCMYDFEFEDRLFKCGKKSWRTHKDGMQRVIVGNRIMASGALPNFIQYHDDFPVQRLHNLWNDTHGATDMKYTVQTSNKVIQRCLLMTTDPGDLVLDPTCGGGTTAYVAEQWGRRWITIDTSRVSIALARQRLLTSSFDYYKLKDESKGIEGGIVNKIVPHIMLKNIAQNTALDPIFEKHAPILTEKLDTLNSALAVVTSEIRTKLLTKLAEKESREGSKSITDADRRRWQLPETAWQEWEVPFDTDL